jgi:hypothetical protein
MKAFLVIVLLSISNIVFAGGTKYDRDQFILDSLHAVNNESASLPELQKYTCLEIYLIKNATAGSATKWKKDTLDKIKNNNLQEAFTDDNLLLLRHYVILNTEEESQKGKNDGTYSNVNDLEKEPEELQKEKSRKQDDLLNDFVEKWGVKPGEPLFDDYIEKYPSDITEASENYASIVEAKYNGKNEIIKKNIESYKKILGIYQKLKKELGNKSPKDITKQYFSRNIGHFAEQIKSMVSKERESYNREENDYNMSKEEKAVFDTKEKTVLFINDTGKNIIVVKNREKCEYKAIDMKESRGRIFFALKDI